MCKSTYLLGILIYETSKKIEIRSLEKTLDLATLQKLGATPYSTAMGMTAYEGVYQIGEV